MTLTEKYKQHIIECPQCDEVDTTKLCPIAQALIAKLVSQNKNKS